MKSLTKKQSEYINYMLTNAYTDDKDQRALAAILRETGKHAYSELTVSEASKLIAALRERCRIQACLWREDHNREMDGP